MRATLTLALMLAASALGLNGRDVYGAWVQVVGRLTVIKVFEDGRFYTIFLGHTGGIAYYGTGTYKQKGNQITYAYEGGIPREVFTPGRVESETVELGWDTLTVNIADERVTLNKLPLGAEGRLNTSKVKETIHEVSEADQIPSRISAPGLDFPIAMQREGIEGIVIEEVVIGSTGSVICARAIAANRPEFVRVVASCARRLKFEPPTVAGQPACVRMVVPFLFRLKG